MIEDDILPAGWNMTDRTILPELAVMVIILGVAGKTALGCAFEIAVGMTGQTTHVRMIADQRESRFVMIKWQT